MHEDYAARGQITAGELELFINAYKPYHDLGGNDVATAYLDDVQRLPIRN